MKAFINKIFLFASVFAAKNVSGQNAPGATVSSSTTISAIAPYSVSNPEAYPPIGFYTGTTDKFNTVRVYHPLVPMQSVPSFDATRNMPILVSTTYKDGFDGALMQINRNNLGSDIVKPFDYRIRNKTLDFLPYPESYHSKFQSAVYSQQKNYYLNKSVDGKEAPYALAYTSNANGIPSVTKLHAGETNTGFSTVTKSNVNTTNEIPIVTLSAGNLCISGYYGASQLTSQRIEQGVNGVRQARTYTNKSGQLVCKKEYAGGSSGIGGWLITYYLYDDKNRLTAVIPPGLSTQLHVSTCVSNINGKYFSYKYDDRGQLIEKGTPGQSVTEKLIYDRKGRLVMTQTPNLAQQSLFYFTIYDDLNRPIVDGLYRGGSSADATYWHGVLRGDYPPLWSGPEETTLEHWYLNDTKGQYPTILGACAVLKRYYYDYYQTSPANGITFNTGHAAIYLTGAGILSPEPYTLAHGRLVATQTYMPINSMQNNFADTSFITAYFYDERGNLIQTQTKNPWGKWDITTSQYNFAGQKVLDIADHAACNAVNKSSTRIETKYTYGANTGMADEVYQRYDGGTWKKINGYAYNDLAQVQEKWLGNAELQNYTYNVRGQLKGINEDVLTGVATMPDNGSYFSILNYEKGYAQNTHDGKLSGYYWRTKGTDVGSYGYTYDLAGRMIHADYYKANSANAWSKSVEDYTVSNLIYDDNGNIIKMNQRGPTASGPGDIDQLVYSYDALNRLSRVIDNGVNSPTVADFDNGTTGTTNDYTYDENGNLKSDANKGITSIIYDYQDKPLTVASGAGNIKNIYTADGAAVQKTIVENGVTNVYRYWGPYVYRNDSLLYVLTPEGRARWRADSSFFAFDFFVRDHQGNVRTVVEEKHEFVTLTSVVATFEVVASTVEEAVWEQVGEVRDISPTLTPQDASVGRLNACEPDHRIGAAMLVHAMAGDQINLQGYVYYQGEDAQSYDIHPESEAMLSSLVTALTGGATVGAEGATASVQKINDLLTPTNYAAYETLKNAATNTSLPRAYLNVLVFDEQFQLRPEYSVVKQVSTGPANWQLLELDAPFNMQVSGYTLVYFSNESCADVAINNVGFTRYYGNLLEEQHYYPHGLVVQPGNPSTPLTNKYLFETNKNQDELGVHLYDFNARQYDPQIGRFWGIDPLAGLPRQTSMTPYHFCGNDPANFVDPFGLERWYYGYQHGQWGLIHEYAEIVKGESFIVSDLVYAFENSPANGGGGSPGGAVGGGGGSGGPSGPGGAWRGAHSSTHVESANGGKSAEERKKEEQAKETAKKNEEMEMAMLKALDYKQMEVVLDATAEQRNVADLFLAQAEAAMEMLTETSTDLIDPTITARELEGLNVAKGIIGIAGKALGVVSIVEHSGQAYNAFQNGDYLNGSLGVGKVALDVVFTVGRSTNPFILTGSIVYTLWDLSGTMTFKH